MEDENGLELRLGLTFGSGSSGKLKAKNVFPNPTNEEGTSSRNVNSKSLEVSFRNIFQSGNENLPDKGKQTVEHTLRDKESFWIDLRKPLGSSVDDSNDLWGLSGKNVVVEEKSASMKHKLLFEEANFHKRQEGGAIEFCDSFSKSPVGFSLLKKPRVSTTAEDGSIGENEDAADSNSLLIPQLEDNVRTSDIPKNSDKLDLSRRSSLGTQLYREETKQELEKVAFRIPVSLQSIKALPLPFSMPVKGSTTTSNPSNSSGLPLPSVRQLMPLPKNSRDVQLAFGYSPTQLPTLETNPSWLFSSRKQNASSSEREDGTPNTGNPEDDENSLHVSIKPLSDYHHQL